MRCVVDAVRVELEFGPTELARDTVGPFFTTGEIVVLRLTVPLKPLVPSMVIVKVAEAPLATVWVDGVAVMLKSAVPVTVTAIVVECNSVPLAPVSVTV